MTRRHRTPAARSAFTLVEMVVTIGVIIVLTALTVSATIALSRRSEAAQTENIIRLLDLALGEYETQADRKLTWGPSGGNADITDGTPHVFTLTEVLRRIRRSSDVKTILAQIKPEFVYTYNSANPDLPVPLWLPETPDPDEPDPYVRQGNNPRSIYLDGSADGEMAVLDAWGVPIRAVHPGRLHDPSPMGYGDPPNTRDLDGTIHISALNSDGLNEMIYGACENRRVRFVSAGPDGKFGDLSQTVGTPMHEQAHDNIWSYKPEDDHG